VRVEQMPRDFSSAASLSSLRIRALNGGEVPLRAGNSPWFCGRLQAFSTDHLQG
jgi:hypothetical protein